MEIQFSTDKLFRKNPFAVSFPHLVAGVQSLVLIIPYGGPDSVDELFFELKFVILLPINMKKLSGIEMKFLGIVFSAYPYHFSSETLCKTRLIIDIKDIIKHPNIF